MRGLPSITTNSRGENDQILFSFQWCYLEIYCIHRSRRVQRFRRSRSIGSPMRRYASPSVWTSRYHRRTSSESLEASRLHILPISQGFHIFANLDACLVWQYLLLVRLQTISWKVNDRKDFSFFVTTLFLYALLFSFLLSFYLSYIYLLSAFLIRVVFQLLLLLLFWKLSDFQVKRKLNVLYLTFLEDIFIEIKKKFL